MEELVKQIQVVTATPKKSHVELVLKAVPDGWAKVDGEWVRITDDGVGYGRFDIDHD